MAIEFSSSLSEEHVPSKKTMAQLCRYVEHQQAKITSQTHSPSNSFDKPAWDDGDLTNAENDRILAFLLIEQECRNLSFDEASFMLCQLLSLSAPGELDLHQLIFDCYQELDMRTYHNPAYCQIVDSEISMIIELFLYTPIGDPNRPALLRILASLLERRFQDTDNPSNLNMAISCYYQSILLSALNDTCDHILGSDILSLGNLCYSRFQHTHKLPDISQAITCYSYLVNNILKNSPSLCSLLNVLGGLFYTRYERTGDLADINQTILTQDAAISCFPEDHHDKPECLSNLGLSHMRRFEALNKLTDIDTSIQYSMQALSITPHDHPDRSGRLCNLGNSYDCRYERLGDLKDLELAILYHQEAVTSSAHDAEIHALCLDSLGSSLARQFEIKGQLADIDQILSCHLTSVHLTAEGDLSRAERLNNLGNAYGRRFGHQGQLSDLDLAIQYIQEAVRLTSQDHPHYVEWLENLGVAFNNRFEHLDTHEDLRYAIQYLERATSLTLEGDSRLPGRLGRLCMAVMSRLDCLGLRKDLEWLVILSRSAALSFNGDTSTLFQASYMWAMMSERLNGLPCLDACKRLMSLVPRIVWIGSNMSKQFADVPQVSNVVMRAVNAAMALGQYNLALEWLEQGRSIVWNQVGQLRTPIEDLYQASPTLADELNRVARDLDQAHQSRPGKVSADPQYLRSQEEAVRMHHNLAKRWEELLAQARKVPGFHGFLKPKTLSELASAARDRAVVIIVVEDQYCSALALLPGSQDLVHIPLLTFSYNKAAQARARLADSLKKVNARERGVRADKSGRGDGFESVLSMLWLDVAKPILDRLGYINPNIAQGLPRVTWCTTGPLAFLPLHAAGLYNVPQSRVFDFVVSSYTPTIGALVENLSCPSEFHGLLTVGQSITPGFAPLNKTTEELDRVAAHTTGLKFTRLDEGLATTSAVSDAMKSHSWVHFACHGSQNKLDPTASAFHLIDGPLDLATIIQRPLPHAGFAFLSACQTATGSEEIPEESAHLAAGMVMAGYRSVIGTMWSIRDVDAPVVADRVYAELLKDGVPDSSRAAVALHVATKELRETVGEKLFSAWVPYIHIGI